MWGSVYTNCSGRSLVEALDVHDLVVLNTTTPTHLSFTGRNAWSLLDLALVSSSCASLCTSTVTSEFLGSDHLVVLTAVKASTMPEDLGVPKWNFGKADGQKFSAACDHTLGSFSISLDYAYCLFETSVREAALEGIPQSKRSIKIVVPWWNKQCDIAVKNKKHAFNRMKRTWLLRDIIIFKRYRAKAPRVILEAKSSSWRQFCTSLTSTINLSKVWKVIKSFSGNRRPCFIPTLLAQGISATNKQHKSNVLANQFVLSSSSANYPSRFVNVFLPINTFHSGFENRFAKFPNVPYRYVFRQLSLEVLHLHRTPLKCRQRAKIRTTVVWGAWERKSRSSACRRSNVGLPICLYLFLMQSTVLQIFIKVLNITFFPITLHSLRFMIHAKTKPNNGLSGVELRFRKFLSICVLPTTSILPDFTCKKSTSWKSKVFGSLLGKFPTHQHLGLCCIHCVFCSFQYSNLPMFSMEVPFREIFFLSNF